MITRRRIDPGGVVVSQAQADVEHADQSQEPVDPSGRAQHRLPDEDAGHEGHHVGQEEEHPEARGAPDGGAVQQQRDGERRRPARPAARAAAKLRVTPSEAQAWRRRRALRSSRGRRTGAAPPGSRVRLVKVKASVATIGNGGEDHKADEPRRDEEKPLARLAARQGRHRSTAAETRPRSSRFAAFACRAVFRLTANASQTAWSSASSAAISASMSSPASVTHLVS